jgi:putative endonuclease
MISWKGFKSRWGAPVSVPVDKASTGAQAEDLALRHLQARGLALVERNYRVARGRSRHGGEIDLIVRDRDGTLVFVEVRARSGNQFGGAAASVTTSKQRKLVYAAQCYLQTLAVLPPCRFDVVAVQGDQIHWLPAAFAAE